MFDTGGSSLRSEDPPWIGVVLAGGRSSRMGADKAFLRWQGIPLLDWMLSRLALAGAARCVVSGARPGYACIPDVAPALGPLAGLAAVAHALSDAQLLIVPLDMPLLSPELLHLLMRTGSTSCAHFCGAPMPMRMRLDATTRIQIGQLMQQESASKRSLRALQQALQAERWPVPAGLEAQLTGANTPEQWLQLQALERT